MKAIVQNLYNIDLQSGLRIINRVRGINKIFMIF